MASPQRKVGALLWIRKALPFSWISPILLSATPFCWGVYAQEVSWIMLDSQKKLLKFSITKIFSIVRSEGFHLFLILSMYYLGKVFNFYGDFWFILKEIYPIESTKVIQKDKKPFEPMDISWWSLPPEVIMDYLKGNSPPFSSIGGIGAPSMFRSLTNITNQIFNFKIVH